MKYVLTQNRGGNLIYLRPLDKHGPNGPTWTVHKDMAMTWDDEVAAVQYLTDNQHQPGFKFAVVEVA